MGLPQKMHGMIATSGSWRRHWLAWRRRAYPLIRL